MHRLSLRKKLLFSLIALLLCFHGLELAFRVYQFAAHQIPVFGANGQAINLAGTTPIITPHPLLHFALNPLHEEHTADRFRQTPPVDQPALTICCMGGSSTYGTRVSSGEAYPAQLQQALNADGLAKAKVLNAGVPAWSLPHHLARYLFDLRNRNPPLDLVVFYFGYNDLWTSVTHPATGIAHDERLRSFQINRPFWRHYRVLVWAFARWNALSGRVWIPVHLNDYAFHGPSHQSNEINPESLHRFEREFILLLDTMTRDKVPALVVLQDYAGDATHTGTAQFEIMRDHIRNIAEHKKVPLVDMRDVTQSNPRYFADPVHMNAEGNQLRAQHLADTIRPLLP